MSPAAALLWAMNVSAERSLQAAVGGRFETLVGVVPETSLMDSEASVAMAVIPVAGLDARRQNYQLAILYRPRIYWRFPNPVNFTRPLLLHQGVLTHRLALSRRTSWTNQLDGSIGEIDYTLASAVFDPTQPTVPDESITKLVRVNAATGIGHSLTTRASTGFTLSGSYSAPLNRSEDPDYLTSLDGEIEPYYTYQFGTRDSGTLACAAGYAWFQDESSFFAVTPSLTWGHDFSRQTAGALGAGLAYLQVLESSDPDGPAPGDTDVTPTAEASIKSRVLGERGMKVDAGVAAEYRWFFDPVLGRPVQRAGGGVFTQVNLPPDWTAGAAVSFFTTVGQDKFEPTEEEGIVRRDETILRIDAPVTYRITRLLGLEFGVRSALRGPPVADGVDLDRVELWFYGALRLVFDPKDQDSGWSR